MVGIYLISHHTFLTGQLGLYYLNERSKTMTFSDLPIGTIFTCVKGKYRKIKNGADRYGGNAIGVNFPRLANIQATTKVVVEKER